jgi:mannose-6-phosphate isomerase-like protein (cupin superfamily)
MTTRLRRATPRPVYQTETVVSAGDAAAHLWGDDASGFVSDRVYLSSEALHVLEFTLPPGGRFVHSATNPTIFAADVAYVVLEGELWIADPETGEVRHVEAGELVFFRRDTWHHAFNPAPVPVRVLEFFAPPPARGTSSPYARRQPPLRSVHYSDERWRGDWPSRLPEREAAARLRVLREEHLLWGLCDDRARHVEGLAIDTEHLSVAYGRVSAGYVGGELQSVDETLLFVVSGLLNVHLPDMLEGERAWFELAAGDALFLPPGTSYRLVEQNGVEARYWKGSGRPVPDGWSP